MKPLKESIRVSPKRNTLGEECFSNMKHFGRVPIAVYRDPRLNYRDHTAYGLIASTLRVKTGNVTGIGMRLLGELMRASAATAYRSVKKLVEAGHLVREGEGKGHRAKYRLTSPVFGAGTTVATVGTPQVTLNHCGRCSKMRKVNVTGYCRGCRLEAELERRQKRAVAG